MRIRGTRRLVCLSGRTGLRVTRARRRTRKDTIEFVPDRLYFTDSDEANELIATDPMALLVGFALDQQVQVQKAFHGPLALKERLGSIDAATARYTGTSSLFICATFRMRQPRTREMVARQGAKSSGRHEQLATLGEVRSLDVVVGGRCPPPARQPGRRP